MKRAKWILATGLVAIAGLAGCAESDVPTAPASTSGPMTTEAGPASAEPAADTPAAKKETTEGPQSPEG